ncbi:MAG TPA: hypothetical protein VIK86_09055 [Candidatus Paceibacterota bacterium]
MRKIEIILGTILAGLFFYCFIELLFVIPGCLESSPTYPVPFRVGFPILIMGTLLSGILGMVTPMWNVGKYFHTNDVKRISDFKSYYKVSYIFMFMGYLGLTLCYVSEGKILSLFVLGVLFLLPFLCYMFVLPFFQNNYERVKRN